MFDISKYIVNNEVKRSKIASDISYGVLTKEDIGHLIKNSTITSAYIGSSMKSRLPKEKWTKEYREKLVCMSIAECFNSEYLFHLQEVSEFLVNKKKSKKGIIIGGAIAIIAIAVIIVIASK